MNDEKLAAPSLSKTSQSIRKLYDAFRMGRLLIVVTKGCMSNLSSSFLRSGSPSNARSSYITSFPFPFFFVRVVTITERTEQLDIAIMYAVALLSAICFLATTVFTAPAKISATSPPFQITKLQLHEIQGHNTTISFTVHDPDPLTNATQECSARWKTGSGGYPQGSYVRLAFMIEATLC